MITWKSLRQIDFIFALVAVLYAVLVSLLPGAAPLAAVFATPTAAALFGLGAAVRWAAALKPGKDA